MEPFLTHLAGLAGETWANRKEIEEVAEELSLSFEDLSLYARISTHMRSLHFSGEMLKALVEELQETLRVDLAFIELPDREEYNAIVTGRDLRDRASDQQAFAHNLIQSIPKAAPSLEQDYFIVNNASNTPGFKELHPEPYRFLAVKVAHNSTFDGWFGLVSFKLEEHFRQSELRLLQSMAKQISVLLANVDLYHNLEKFVINMVRSLVFTIEAKDVYTRGHSERVNRYAMLIAERLRLDDAEKNILNWSSILHDIGKIGIPESILNKPGRLNEEEFDVIKGHPKKGRDILEPLEQLASSLPGILHHHERYDGKGYPHGLKGEEIPFLARIIAVADTFDAITSNRAYRSAKVAEKALAIVEDVAGTQLDPVVVEAFKEVYETTLKAEFEKSDDK
jgi:HD-GYP domain-containing protein (c-di-GMP phosphodiesterase class II)